MSNRWDKLKGPPPNSFIQMNSCDSAHCTRHAMFLLSLKANPHSLALVWTIGVLHTMMMIGGGQFSLFSTLKTCHVPSFIGLCFQSLGLRSQCVLAMCWFSIQECYTVALTEQGTDHSFFPPMSVGKQWPHALPVNLKNKWIRRVLLTISEKAPLQGASDDLLVLNLSNRGDVAIMRIKRMCEFVYVFVIRVIGRLF